MRTLIALFALITASPVWSDAPGNTQGDIRGHIRGPARVIDGDTLWVGESQVRLQGIDAPALDQTCQTRKNKRQDCGQLAKQALARLVRGQRVACKGNRTDSSGRLIALCRLGPFSINEQMVIDGWALAHGDGGEAYARAQTFAKARREGIWRSRFTVPWEWRKTDR